MNIHKIIREEVNDFDWIRDVRPHPFKSLRKGDRVIVTDTTEYLEESLMYCSEEGTISTGIEYVVRDIDTLPRGGCDCGASEDESLGLDPDEEMLSVHLETGLYGFWVTDDMVTLQKL